MSGIWSCQLGMESFDAGEGIFPIWILGDTFLRAYYSVYVRGGPAVFFGPHVCAFRYVRDRTGT